MALKYNVLFLLQIHSEGVDEVPATPDAAALDVTGLPPLTTTIAFTA